MVCAGKYLPEVIELSCDIIPALTTLSHTEEVGRYVYSVLSLPYALNDNINT